MWSDNISLSLKSAVSGNNQYLIKWQEKTKHQQKLQAKLTRKPEEEESKPSPSTSTRCSSKYTPTSVSPRKPWTSWTLSFMILSTELPLKDPSSSDSTREELSHPEKSNLLSSLSSPENSPDMLSPKEPKPSPNTFNNDLIELIILVSTSSHLIHLCPFLLLRPSSKIQSSKLTAWRNHKTYISMNDIGKE
jgi:hypothetical protein